jgi:hypothetical protein
LLAKSLLLLLLLLLRLVFFFLFFFLFFFMDTLYDGRLLNGNLTMKYAANGKTN